MVRVRARLAALVTGLALSASVTAFADPVTHWNNITVNAVTAGRAGPPGLLDIALVQAAVHDAVQAIEGRYERYHYTGIGTGSPAAAVAAAAHRVIWLLYTGAAQRMAIDNEFASYIAANGLAGDPGIAVGEAAADALHAAHYRTPTPDGLPTTPNTGGTGVGEWRPLPGANGQPAPFAFLQLAYSTPFTLNRIDQFRPQPPPPIGSVRYARDYAEVKEKGNVLSHPNPSVAGTDTDLAWFWSGNFIAQWNEAARNLATTYGTSVGDNARLFALLNLAAADAAMAVWDSKLFYNVWRPTTAIREGDNDGNPRTAGDAAWKDLLPVTPAYPDYVSGANGLTGAATGLLRDFFGTDVLEFTVSTGAAQAINKVRSFSSLSQAADEVVNARILLGIHFRFADEEGRRLGERVAHWTFQKFLRPVPGSK